MPFSDYKTVNAILRADSSGGVRVVRVLGAASTNSTLVKASPGLVYGLILTNINAAIRYIKLYDKATAPAVGTDIPVTTIGFPQAPVSTMAMNFPVGITFSNGIGLGLTVGPADNDTTAVAAGEQVVHVLFA